MHFHQILNFEFSHYINLNVIAEAKWDNEAKTINIRIAGEPDRWQFFDGHVAESLRKAIDKQTL